MKIDASKENLILETYGSTGSIRATAKTTGFDRETVRRVVRSIAEDKKKEPPEIIRQRNAALQEEKRLLEAIESENSFRHFIDSLFREVIEPMPKQPKFASRKSKKAHLIHPYFHMSDWHYEERVKSEAVFGLNEYSTEIAARRIFRIVHAFLQWKEDQESSGRIRMPVLTIGLNGDFLTGTLHKLEQYSSAPNVVRACLACGQLLSLVIEELSKHFEKIEIHGTVGNHGRLPDDKKVPTKDPTRSWDYMAYSIAKTYLNKNPSISWNLPDAYGTFFSLAGHGAFQGHGHFLKQSLGIVGYGMRRFAGALASNMAAAGKPISYAFFGHFHQASSAEFAGIKTFISPSLIGTQEYALNSMGEIGKSAQICYCFDEPNGFVSSHTFYGNGEDYPGTYEVQL